MKMLEVLRCADCSASNPAGGSSCANCGARTINIGPNTLSWPGVTPLVLLLLLVQLLGALRCFRQADRQTLHDRMAGTWVVRS
jgi:hypothetical protein